MDTRTLCALINTGASIATLKRLPRAGWLQRGITNPESVAEHSFAVAMLSLMVGSSIEGIDLNRLLQMALLHDYAEALMTDLPASAKRLIGAEVKRTGEWRAMQELLANLPNQEHLLALWQECSDGRTPEARLLKALDRLEMLMQALEYEQAGNQLMSEFWEDVEDGWPDEWPQLRELALMLHSRRPSQAVAPKPVAAGQLWHNGRAVGDAYLLSECQPALNGTH